MNNYKEKELYDYTMLPISVIPDYEYFSFTEEECKIIKHEIGHYENLQAVVIEALKIVQNRYGWVMDCAVIAVANILGVSVTDVESVATFYSQIFREPVGRHIIRFCDSVVCYVSGCQNVQKKFEDILCIKLGETTLDNRFTFLPVSCLGRCDLSPVVMIDNDIHSCVSSMDIVQVLGKYL